MRGESQNTETRSRRYLKGGAAERNRNTMLLMPRSKIKRAGVVNRRRWFENTSNVKEENKGAFA